MQRLQVVLGHLRGPADSGWMPQAAPCLSGAPQASAADVVVVHGRRTAICRAGRGGFKDTTPDELLSAVMTAVLKDVNLRPEQLGDICVDQHGVSYVFLFYIHTEMCCSLGPGQSWPESPSF
ncbi:acetyl-CoA acyltransferase 1 [Homo sapiens]|uniref:acetyl-CoA C-acetyltransferase n=2 Tax=Hominidae TaxID=9604 RepID=F2Z3P7_HUMAN|nr:acetyl-CoA acyltransferase 1 [Homo sapiens]PNJ74755.1 ACAA1 isoform 1 [Pongo abelii]KAI2528855.1 acetyl-CoA acyltransferase 1 [Homo sapiens]KAI4028919.1 acetyl-CoA acyltransferase 1 [Homo sapiens]KAI4028920.1 acetyl-CoA acyltransferase 1 [Homo sapiens]